MPDELVLDLPTVSELVRLRMLAEDSRRRSEDTSEAGRHLALISLDGACEYALWLAGRAHGAKFKERSSRSDMVSTLKSLLGERWKLQGWPGVEQLHRARNNAQHAAVAIDPIQLPQWRDAAWAFIDSLCTVAFERSLNQIVLADAVRDPSLHDLLRRSEEALIEDPLLAFTLATAAFGQARLKWRVQRRRKEFVVTPAGTLVRADPTAAVRSDLQALDNFLEVQMFANDAGECVWLEHAREEQQETGWTPPPDEARRALLFAASWIVRWEIFNLGYPLDKWQAHRDSIHPPEIGESKQPLLWLNESRFFEEVPGRPARGVVLFQLANVPGRGRPPWGPLLEQAVVEGAAEAGLSSALADTIWHQSGTLLLWITLGHDSKVVAGIVRQAVDRAYTRYISQHADAEQRERQRLEAESALRDVVFAARSDLSLFGAVTVQADKESGTQDWLGCVELRLGAAGQAELRSVVNIFRGARGVLAKTDRFDNGVAFDLFELTDDNNQVLARAICSCEEEVQHLRDHAAKQRLAFQTFVEGLRQELGEPPEGMPLA